jgi:hypothetical protein
MAAATLLTLPLDLTEDPRPVDRVTAHAIHLALWPVADDPAADELVAAAGADLRTLLVASARMDHALAGEHSTVIERAARHLRAAADRLRET